MLKSVVENNIVPAKNIIIYDIKKKNTQKFKKDLNVEVAKDEIELFLESEYVFIAVKPQFIPELLDKIISNTKDNNHYQNLVNSKTIISIAAGITLDFYENKFGKGISAVRIMPNILASVNEAASALTPNINVSAEQLDFVTQIFEKIGLAVQVKEHLMDVVTGMSGSGPAFIAILVEAMADGAVFRADDYNSISGWNPDGFRAGVKDMLTAEMTVKGIREFLRSDKNRVTKEELKKIYHELGGVMGSLYHFVLEQYLKEK